MAPPRLRDSACPPPPHSWTFGGPGLALQMASAYERLYFHAFSRRTLLAGATLVLAHMATFILLDVLGGSTAWLRVTFYLRHLVVAMPLVVALLARLRPVANPDLRHAASIVNKVDLGMTAARFLVNLSFLRAYFAQFAPSYLVLYAYPEGKYGPPLLREQPFFLASFAAMLEVVGLIRPVWHYRRAKPAAEDFSNVLAFGTEMFRLGARRSLNSLGVSFALLFAESAVLMPHAYALYVLFVGTIHTVRRVPHSFHEFLDIRMLYHLIWTGLALSVLHTCVEIVVVYFFERCFHLCQGSPHATSLLLSGLQSERTGVKRQAMRELEYSVENETEWRAAFFEDFVGEEAASQVLCKLIVGLLNKYKAHIELINADLSLFSREYGQVVLGEVMPEAKVPLGEAGIFSPRRKNVFESVLGGIQARMDLKPEEPKATVKEGPIPDVLETKQRLQKGKKSAGGEAGTTMTAATATAKTRIKAPQFPNEPGLKIILAALGRFNSYPARVFAGIAMELIKSRWLGEEDALIWLVDALGSLVIASYDEDTHGQVQFVLDDVFLSLAGLVGALRTFEELPRLADGRRVAEDLFGTLPSPVEIHARRLRNAAMAALEMIVEKFADSLNQLKLGVATRDRLREVGIVV